MKGKKQGVEYLVILAFAILLVGFGCITDMAAAQSKTVPDLKIAVVYPLSGALSRNGNLTVQGIKAAMGWVNDNGGIKSLGGAKLVPVVGDGGGSVEGHANAMERICRDPDIIMAMGSWLSAATLATTEITERLKIPQFSISYMDSLHERGFKYGFYVATPVTRLGETEGFKFLAKIQAGGATKTMMVVGDDALGSRGFYEVAKKSFANMGIKLLAEETWPIGTLTDATPVMLKVRKLNPGLVVYSPSAISENQMCLMKRKELGIKIPFMSAGSMGDPSLRQLGADIVEGLLFYSTCYPSKAMPQDWIKRSLDQCRKEYADEPWVGQELSYGWTMVPIMAEILERAGSRDRQKLREVGHKLDIHDVMATKATPKQGMAFDETGRIAKKYQDLFVAQWMGGVPRTVYPLALAEAKPNLSGN